MSGVARVLATVLLATAGFVAVSALLGDVDVVAAVIFAVVVCSYLAVTGMRARRKGR